MAYATKVCRNLLHAPHFIEIPVAALHRGIAAIFVTAIMANHLDMGD